MAQLPLVLVYHGTFQIATIWELRCAIYRLTTVYKAIYRGDNRTLSITICSGPILYEIIQTMFGLGWSSNEDAHSIYDFIRKKVVVNLDTQNLGRYRYDIDNRCIYIKAYIYDTACI